MQKKNVGSVERVASVALGSLALWSAWRSISQGFRPIRTTTGTLGMVAAAGLLWRGTTGNCPIYDQVGLDTRELADKAQRQFRMVRSIVINAPIDGVKQILTADGLHGDAFRPNDGGSSYVRHHNGQHWRLKLKTLSGGTRTRMVASIREEDGTTSFRRLAMGVRAGTLRSEASDELRNLKALSETGEIATVVGQSHGDRSIVGKALIAAADRDSPTAVEDDTSRHLLSHLNSTEAST